MPEPPPPRHQGFGVTGLPSVLKPTMAWADGAKGQAQLSASVRPRPSVPPQLFSALLGLREKA